MINKKKVANELQEPLLSHTCQSKFNLLYIIGYIEIYQNHHVRIAQKPLWELNNINIESPGDFLKEKRIWYLYSTTLQTDPQQSDILGSKDVLRDKSRSSQRADPSFKTNQSVDVYPPNTPATLFPKITRAKHIKQITALLTENENLKAQIHENLKCNTMDSVKPKVLTPGRYAIDVEPIPPRNKNNRELHLDYLKHLKESVETLREIVEEAKIDRQLDRSLASACLYTKHS
ncbi:hypothetical protein Tco_1110610 [Tanacetum coccineum]|uniref:Uncharacterized protein n=1 Tax=Tanacetum coccineum TaxID=301880 RepID=A0ABQ5ILP5_9ASTR